MRTHSFTVGQIKVQIYELYANELLVIKFKEAEGQFLLHNFRWGGSFIQIVDINKRHAVILKSLFIFFLRKFPRSLVVSYVCLGP